jgi:hypothetical protein
MAELLGLPYFSWYKIPKRDIEHNVPFYHKINLLGIKYTKWPLKPDAIKIPNGHKIPNIFTINIHTNIFYSKAFQNFPKFGFLVRKYVYYLAILAWAIEFLTSAEQKTDVMIFKIFSPKNLAKFFAFFAQTTVSFCKNCDHNIGFW